MAQVSIPLMSTFTVRSRNDRRRMEPTDVYGFSKVFNQNGIQVKSKICLQIRSSGLLDKYMLTAEEKK